MLRTSAAGLADVLKKADRKQDGHEIEHLHVRTEYLRSVVCSKLASDCFEILLFGGEISSPCGVG